MVSFSRVERFASRFWVLLLPIALSTGAVVVLIYFVLHPRLETVWTLRGNEFLSEAACYDAANKLNEPRPVALKVRRSSSLPATRSQKTSLPKRKNQGGQTPVVCASYVRMLLGWEHAEPTSPLPASSPRPGSREKST
jgi:hypothetical protein